MNLSVVWVLTYPRVACFGGILDFFSVVLVPYNWCRAKKIEGVLKIVNVGKQGVVSRVRLPTNEQTRCIDDTFEFCPSHTLN